VEKKTQLFIYRTVTSASAAAARRYETSAAAVARCRSLFARNKMDRELGWGGMTRGCEREVDPDEEKKHQLQQELEI
jgi:hypothetical protein